MRGQIGLGHCSREYHVAALLHAQTGGQSFEVRALRPTADYQARGTRHALRCTVHSTNEQVYAFAWVQMVYRDDHRALSYRVAPSQFVHLRLFGPAEINSVLD